MLNCFQVTSPGFIGVTAEIQRCSEITLRTCLNEFKCRVEVFNAQQCSTAIQ